MGIAVLAAVAGVAMLRARRGDARARSARPAALVLVDASLSCWRRC